MKKDRQFVVREYGRQELACMYCPGVQPGSAWKKFKEWIQFYPGLADDLSRHGYDPRRRTFPPHIVRIIVEAMGEP